MTSKLAAESRPLVGSSRNKIFGAVMSCAATLRRRFCPPEIPFRIGVPIKVCSCALRPNASTKLSMRWIRSALERELRRYQSSDREHVLLRISLRVRETSCKVQSLTDCQRPNESIFLFNIAAQLSKIAGGWVAAIDQCRSLDLSSRCLSASEHIEKGRLSRAEMRQSAD